MLLYEYYITLIGLELRAINGEYVQYERRKAGIGKQSWCFTLSFEKNYLFMDETWVLNKFIKTKTRKLNLKSEQKKKKE